MIAAMYGDHHYVEDDKENNTVFKFALQNENE